MNVVTFKRYKTRLVVQNNRGRKASRSTGCNSRWIFDEAADDIHFARYGWLAGYEAFGLYAEISLWSLYRPSWRCESRTKCVGTKPIL